MKKRWPRIASKIIAAVALLALGGFLALQTPPAARLILHKTRNYLSSKANIELSASRMRLNLFKRTITLDNVVVRSTSAPDLPPFFRASSVYARVGILSTIRGLPEIRDLQIVAPQIHYFVRQDGRTNLPTQTKPSKSAFRYLIAHAFAGIGSFHYEDLRRHLDLNLPRWELHVRGDRLTLDHQLELATLQPGLLRLQDNTIPLDSIQFLGTMKQDEMDVSLVQLASLHSKLAAKGNIRNFSDPQVNLQFEPDLVLSDPASAVLIHSGVQGRISGKVIATGKISTLDLSATLKGTNVTIEGFRNVGFSSSIRATLSNQRFLLTDFQLDSTQGSLNGKGEFFAGSEKGTNRLDAVLRNFDLYPAWKLIHPPFDLASRGSGRISLNWSGPFSTAALNGKANLKLDTTRDSPAHHTLPVAGNIIAELRAGNISGSLQDATVVDTSLSGRFSLHSFKTIDAEIHGESPNVGSSLSAVSKFVGDPETALAGIGLSGPVQFSAQIGGGLSNPRIAATLESPALQAIRLNDLKVRAEAAIQDSQVKFQGSVALPDASAVEAQGTIDYGSRKTVLTLNAATDRIPVAALLPMLHSSIPLTGNLKASLHLSGPVDNLNGQAQVSGTAITLYKETLGQFDAELQMAGNEIRSNEFRFIRDPLLPDTNYLDTGFIYRLNSGLFEIHANGKDLVWEQRQIPGPRIFDGTVNLTASGKGTFEQPSIDVKLESDNILIYRHRLGPISISATLQDNGAVIETSAPQINASSTARILTRSPYPFDAELHLKNSDLSTLKLVAANKEPLTGTAAATLKGSGNLEELDRAHFSAEVRILDLRAGTLEAHTEGVLEAEYRNKTISILNPATIVSGNSRLQVAGSVPVEQTGASGTVTLKGQIDLEQASAFLPHQEGLAAAGILNLDLSVAGTGRQLSPTGSIRMDNGSVQLPWISVPLSNIFLRADLQPGSIVLQRAEMRLGQGVLTFTGELPFGLLPANIPIKLPRKQGPVRFDADLADFQPQSTGLLPQGVEGHVSVHVSGQAASTDLRSINAELVFRQLDFKVNEISLSQKENSTIVVRNGVATISKLALIGTETSIQATGSASLLPEGPLNLKLLGIFDAALLTSMEKDLKTAGRMLVRASVGGNRRSPNLSGVAEMTGGRFTLREPRVVADSLRIGLDLAPDKITVREFKSTLNGGTLTLGGTIGYERGELNHFNLKAAIHDVFLNFPEGLRSASNGELTITSSDENIVLGGTVRVLESSYRDPFAVSGSILSFLKSQRVMSGDNEPSPLLQRLRYDVSLRTTAPLLIQNNIAKAEATANLRLVGSYYHPSFVGRITLDQGGEIVMNQRTYYIERGTITLTDQSQIRPELDIEAQTKVGNEYTITFRLTGPLERLSTVLSSEPSLPEPDILSLLLTGKVSSESTQQVARTQALALVAGQAGEEITREARRALHLSTFRLDPGGLVGSESDMGARLTIGEDITRKLSLAYSMDLVNSGKQIWAAQYKITRTFTAQATKQEDNSYRAEFRHDLRFGGTTPTRSSRTSQTKFTIGAIQFRGVDTEFEKVLRERFKVKPGDKYDFPKVQKSLDRLHDLYSGQKRLEANVRLQRETKDQTVSLDISIEPGPILDFTYQGMPLPDKVKESVEAAWKNGVFDVERVEDATDALRRQLLSKGYLGATITHSIETQGDRKIVHFSMEPGTRYAPIPVLFPGTSGIGLAELQNALDRANLELEVYANPQKVADYLKLYYRERGYLQATVDLPQPHLDSNAGTGEVSIPVHEGPLFKVGDLEFSGQTAFEYDQLWSVIPTSSGSIYSPKSMQDAIRALESLYHGKGYNDVSIAYRVLQNAKAARADVMFQITERRQSVIREIVIEGYKDTRESFIRRQLDFDVGDTLDLSRIDETRKRLYSTGVYTSVDFQNEELPVSASNADRKDMRVRVRVREVRPYRLQYGFLYDTDRGPGGLMEAQNLNVFGRASSLGLKLRYDSDLKEARISYNQPYVTNTFPKLDATAFVQQENRVAFDAHRVGFALFRQKALKRKYVFDYGYRYDYVRWDGLPPDPTLYQSSAPVSRLVATVTRDTRDSILDATRGEFTSHSFEFGPSWLGSETGFARYSGQYFRYVPLDKYVGKPVKDKEGNRLPASLVYAGALRLGLTTAFSPNQDVISPERFFAGGGTTMRGFQQDKLGPMRYETDRETGKPVERPVGGEAMFLFNNEIRFPIAGFLQGVGFVDIGNVYPRVSDFNFNLRKTAGIGLRLKIKFVPIRFDYGFKLDRRKKDESRGAFFFSIGQAF